MESMDRKKLSWITLNKEGAKILSKRPRQIRVRYFGYRDRWFTLKEGSTGTWYYIANEKLMGLYMTRRMRIGYLIKRLRVSLPKKLPSRPPLTISRKPRFMITAEECSYFRNLKKKAYNVDKLFASSIGAPTEDEEYELMLENRE